MKWNSWTSRICSTYCGNVIGRQGGGEFGGERAPVAAHQFRGGAQAAGPARRRQPTGQPHRLGGRLPPTAQVGRFTTTEPGSFPMGGSRPHRTGSGWGSRPPQEETRPEDGEPVNQRFPIGGSRPHRTGSGWGSRPRRSRPMYKKKKN